jgi:hypothetical protein
MSSGQYSLIWVQKSPAGSAAPVPAAPADAPPLAAPPLVAAALDAADEDVLLVLLLLHADSTSASAPMPAMVAVNFFAGL